jgi:hypothetical protein
MKEKTAALPKNETETGIPTEAGIRNQQSSVGNHSVSPITKENCPSDQVHTRIELLPNK